ncbi:hypothetical protein [Kitasatospora sp. NPDC089509]|uniref:hypothetical protein n=1 Tax=Kitasatospora sp. NPDC089509 TaxID=3364079 RepID=UPI00380DF67D
MLRQVVHVMIGIAAAVMIGTAGTSPHPGTTPSVAAGTAAPATPEGCSGNPAGCV